MNPRLLMLLWPYDDDFDRVFESGEVSIPPDAETLEWTLPVNRLHWTLKESKHHHSFAVNRVHYELEAAGV